MFEKAKMLQVVLAAIDFLTDKLNSFKFNWKCEC